MTGRRTFADLLAAFDASALVGALRAGGAPAGAEGLLRGRLRRTDPEAAQALLSALLEQAIEPVVSVARLEAFAAAAERLGWGDEARGALVARRVGITERRLTAYGLFGLSLASTQREVKAAHRRAAKRLHPDRLVRSPVAVRAEAERHLAQLNVARDLLLGDEGVVLAGADDVTLEAPHFDPEDAPTVVWGESVEEDAETVVVDEGSIEVELLWR